MCHAESFSLWTQADSLHFLHASVPVFLVLHLPPCPPSKSPSPCAWYMRCPTIWPLLTPDPHLLHPSISIPQPLHRHLNSWAERAVHPASSLSLLSLCLDSSHDTDVWISAHCSSTSVKPPPVPFCLIVCALKSTSGARLVGLNPTYHFPALWPWACYLNCQPSLMFFSGNGCGSWYGWFCAE